MQIVLFNEMIVLILLSIKIGDIMGMINLCILYVVFEFIMLRLLIYQWFVLEKKIRVLEEYDVFRECVNKVKLLVVVELGEFRILILEFFGFLVGDVIMLNKLVDEGLFIKVGDRLKYMGSLGMIKDCVVV